MVEHGSMRQGSTGEIMFGAGTIGKSSRDSFFACAAMHKAGANPVTWLNPSYTKFDLMKKG